MATKPATTPEIWASNAVYTTGPFIGSPSVVLPAAAVAAEGHRPGALFPTAAEHENYEAFWVTTWVTSWLSLGSSAGAADAHIVETAADGRFRVEGADVIASNPNPYALFVRAPPGAGNAIQATGASAFGDATILGNSTGPGAAVEAQAGTGPGLLATSSGAGAAAVVQATGTGYGLQVTGGAGDTAIEATAGVGQFAGDFIGSATGTTALRAMGGVARAILGLGLNSGIGGQFTGGPTATAGAIGDGSSATAYGLHGRTDTNAGTSARGVYAEGRNNAAGLEAIAPNYYGAIITGDTSSPTYAALKISGANVRPAAAFSGDLAFSLAEDQLVVGSGLSGNFRGLWSSPGGKMTGFTTNSGTVVAGAAYATGATATAAGVNAPKVAGGTVILRFRCEARMQSAGVGSLNIRLIDSTAGTTLVTRAGATSADDGGYLLPLSTTDQWQRSIVLDFQTTVPAAGDRVWTVEVQRQGAINVILRDVSLVVDGLY